MLTKEECEKALESLSNPPYESSCGGCICGVSDCGDCPNNKANKVLNQLIDEHFSNPPLKFEELKAGMWVWNNYSKRYMLIDFIREDVLVADELQYDPKENEYDYEVQYEPNRFYRKEVRE